MKEKEWESYAKKFLKADIAIILDLPTSVALKRINQKIRKLKLKKAIFENKDTLNKVRTNFRKMKNFEEVTIVNGNQSKKKVFSDILRILKKFGI